MHILHLLPNDPKFVDYIVDYFSRVDLPGVAQSFSIADASNGVRTISRIAPFDSNGQVSRQSENPSAVITHSLNPYQARIINQLPCTTPVAWTLFGAEYHNRLPNLKQKLYFDRTKAASEKLQKAARSLTNNHQIPENILRKSIRFAHKISRRIEFIRTRQNVVKAMNRVNLIGVLFKEEFDLLQRELNCEANWCEFAFYNIDDTVTLEIRDELAAGDNVLLGNSATLSNNHLDLFPILQQHRKNFSRIIVPLSYGNERYKNVIINEGRRVFGDQFLALTEFMERRAYNRQLLSCKVAIMNHRRQQAFGNIVTLLWLGVKVYLTEDSTIRKYFHSKGVTLYSIEKDLRDPENHLRFKKLDTQHIVRNRKALSRILSQSQVHAYAEELTRRLISSCPTS